MSPRRKKAESEEAAAPVDGVSAPELKPKKTSATRKKAAAKPAEAPLAVPAPALPPPPAAPKPPVNIPIKPIPQIAVPPKIVIEPDKSALDEVEDLWKPAPRPDADLSQPPKVLLQSKNVVKREVEDILEEPEERLHGSDREGLRPVVRTGLYRKIAMGFAALAVIVGALVMYVVYAHATVTVYPQQSKIETDQDLTVSAAAQGGDVPGAVSELTVTGERTEAPSDATSTDGVAGGTVTLINKTSNDQVLVATTRLLTPDGVLLRLKSRVNVPAHGQIKTTVYADKPGPAGDIGPSTFTIPGLSADLQKSIFAQSDAAMTGGTVSAGIISQADIDKTESDLRADLTNQAEAELAKSIDQKWTGRAFVAETMNRSVSAAPGQLADGVTVRLTLRVRAVAFDRAKALALAMDGLKRGLTSDRELVGVDSDHAQFGVTSADPKTGTASLHVSLSGQSRVSLSSPLFDAGKLRGLDLNAVKAYFEGIEGVERVDVKFRPFWLKRMPDLADHIDFIIQK